MPVLTVTAFTENSPGVLHRITVLFTRRKINIESLTVSETERHGISRFTIVVNADDVLIEKIVKQIARIVEVREAYVSFNRDLLYKEIAFIRVRATAPEVRREIEELAHRYGGTMAFIDQHSVVVERTGTEDEINSLYLLFEPLGIEEFVRSGRIAILKNGHSPDVVRALGEKRKDEISAF